jgi:hypothetical protein
MTIGQRLIIVFVTAALLAGRLACAAQGCTGIVGFDKYLEHARGLVVGDMHGTVEAPAFVTALVCTLSHSGHPVVLGLEYPSQEQHYLERFLSSKSDSASQELLATPFWSRRSQDGRTSQAMLALLMSAQSEIRAGRHIRVLAFDANPVTGLSGTAAFDARDAGMAEDLRHKLAGLTEGEMPIILAGNVHARKVKGLKTENVPGMENAEPLGYLIRDLGFLDLNIDFHGGSLWTCMPPTGCAAHDIGERGLPTDTFSIAPSTDAAYDLLYSVGVLTASPPAAAKWGSAR